MTRLAGVRAAYRWGVLVLAAVVWVRCFGEARLEEFGWQFRLFEVWAVSATAVSTALMVRLSMGWSCSSHAPFVGAVAAANAVVVALHLGPFGLAPVSGLGWHAMSLHLLVPVLQIADALLILGAFRYLRGSVGWVAALALGYVAWLELAVRPLNATADGASGLPYPPLDAMALGDRLGIYAAATAFGLAVLPALWAFQRALRREGTGADGIAA